MNKKRWFTTKKSPVNGWYGWREDSNDKFPVCFKVSDGYILSKTGVPGNPGGTTDEYHILKSKVGNPGCVNHSFRGYEGEWYGPIEFPEL